MYSQKCQDHLSSAPPLQLHRRPVRTWIIVRTSGAGEGVASAVSLLEKIESKAYYLISNPDAACILYSLALCRKVRPNPPFINIYLVAVRGTSSTEQSLAGEGKDSCWRTVNKTTKRRTGKWPDASSGQQEAECGQRLHYMDVLWKSWTQDKNYAFIQIYFYTLIAFQVCLS